MFLKQLGLIVFCAGSLGLTACSGQSWVKGVNLGTQEQNGEEYVQLQAQINTRALQMASITIPIYDPKVAGSLIGQLSLAGGLGTGTSTLTILVKSSALINLPTGTNYAVLPNGTAIPVAGVNSKNWMSIPLGTGSSRVYFNLDMANSKAVFGAALGIDALSVGVAANALMPFAMNNITGLAGIYTGVSSGQSGFALFVDASSLLNQTVTGGTISFIQKAKTSDAAKVQNRILELESKRTLLKAR